MPGYIRDLAQLVNDLHDDYTGLGVKIVEADLFEQSAQMN